MEWGGGQLQVDQPWQKRIIRKKNKSFGREWSRRRRRNWVWWKGIGRGEGSQDANRSAQIHSECHTYIYTHTHTHACMPTHTRTHTCMHTEGSDPALITYSNYYTYFQSVSGNILLHLFVSLSSLASTIHFQLSSIQDGYEETSPEKTKEKKRMKTCKGVEETISIAIS